MYLSRPPGALMFENFGPIFEQNANFGPIFEKSVNFEHFVNGK